MIVFCWETGHWKHSRRCDAGKSLWQINEWRHRGFNSDRCTWQVVTSVPCHYPKQKGTARGIWRAEVVHLGPKSSCLPATNRSVLRCELVCKSTCKVAALPGLRLSLPFPTRAWSKSYLQRGRDSKAAAYEERQQSTSKELSQKPRPFFVFSFPAFESRLHDGCSRAKGG